MIRPFTCVCLILAAGSGLYLYQVKQRAFALDASLRSTFHDIDVARERTRMLRADWALVNDPERLQALAAQYLHLQPMQPSQLLTMDQLAAALPPPVPFDANPAPAPSASPAPASATPASATPGPAPVIDLTHGMPMAEAAPRILPHTRPAPEVALLQPTLAAPDPAPAPAAPALPAPEFVPAPPAPESAQGPAGVAAPASISVPPAPDVATPAPSLAPILAPILAPAVVAAAPSPRPVHHWVRHSTPQAQPWLAEGNGAEAEPRHHAERHATPAASQAPRQFYAANVSPRITPPAATVMYRPASSGSSLGMASSASLAPPRPLYSTSQ